MRQRSFAFSRTLFRLISRFFPSDVRAHYGDELETYFVGTLQAETSRLGWRGVPYVWWNTLYDAFVLRGFRKDQRRHAIRAAGWFHGFRADFRYGIRSARRNPGFAATVIITLTVGLSANIAMFTLFNGVLIRGLPFPNADQLVTAWSVNPQLGLEREGPAPADVLDWEASNTTFQALAAWYVTSVTYQEDEYAEQLTTAQTTGDFFSVLRVGAAHGITYTKNDQTTSHGPAVISHAFWQRRFGADPSIIGRAIRVRGETVPIVGVMPANFQFPTKDVDLWLAWDLRRSYSQLGEIPRTWRFLNVIGRLRPDASMAVAESDLQSVSARIARLYPTSNDGWSVRLNSLFDETVADARLELYLGLGAVGFLLLLTCVNVANIFLARLPNRATELTLRSAIGANRFRLVRQLLTEVGTLVVVSAVFGLIVAAVLVRLVIHLNANTLPRVDGMTINGAVIGFSLALTACVTVLCGLTPVLHVTRDNSVAHSHRNRIGDTRGHQRLRQTLVIAQLAIATTLLVGAVLFSESFRRLRTSDLGINDTNVITYRLSLSPRPDDTEYTQRYYQAVIDSMLALPGVINAGASTALPLDPVGNDFNRPFRSLGDETTSAEAEKGQMRIVSANYFAAIGQPFRFGATFTGRERVDERLVAIVNRRLAEKMWPDDNAVGQMMEIDFRGGWRPYAVIGVVENVKHYGPRNEAVPEIFVPATQTPYLAMSIAVRTENPPRLLEPAIRRALFNLDSQQPPHHFNTLRGLRADSIGEDRFLSMVFGLFGVVALVLATTGVYGVISYTIVQRKREVGIRMALGANPMELAGAIMLQAVVMASVGLAIGLVTAWHLSTVVDDVLYLIEGDNPWVLGAVGITLFSIASFAATFPARRLTRIKPTEALRTE